VTGTPALGSRHAVALSAVSVAVVPSALAGRRKPGRLDNDDMGRHELTTAVATRGDDCADAGRRRRAPVLHPLGAPPRNARAGHRRRWEDDSYRHISEIGGPVLSPSIRSGVPLRDAIHRAKIAPLVPITPLSPIEMTLGPHTVELYLICTSYSGFEHFWWFERRKMPVNG
jgi:hypothetical protein